MSTAESIAAYSKAITELLTTETTLVLTRLQEAEKEAIARINQIAPTLYDYDAAAVYCSESRRTLESRVAHKEIAFRKKGHRVLFTRGALDEYLQSQTTAKRELRPLTL
ncbi:MAG: hypothetical protein QOE70_4062 [Chthoniobacter sp.]|jgi:hypothetical protein|nr:hypothetical protein [Chthoniobacter sp.]